MSWQEEVFGPLLERTMENAQARHLAEQYDLSRDSRLARAIVEYTNAVLDAEEKRRQVARVRPGELLLRTHRGPLVLPLPEFDSDRISKPFCDAVFHHDPPDPRGHPGAWGWCEWRPA